MAALGVSTNDRRGHYPASSPAKNAPFEQGNLTRLAKPGAKKLPELAHARNAPIPDFEVGVAATLPLKQFNHVVNEDENGCRSVELAHIQNRLFLWRDGNARQ